MNKENIYIIIPVHNRKAITLHCLDTLENNGDLAKYHVIVVDDGSTDGTSEMIESIYPEVIILKGDGNLWWTGAIVKGMEYAYEKGAEYFIWLNDDCYPLENSIPQLIEFCHCHHQSIAAGQCIDLLTHEPSYGGIIGQSLGIIQVHSTNQIFVGCDGLAGNFVCFNRSAIDTCGYPNPQIYPHYCGDIAYTNKLKKAKFNLYLINSAKALCKNDQSQVSWLLPNTSLLHYWLENFKKQSPHYWKALLNSHFQILGIKGIWIYFYQYFFKFWIIFILVVFVPEKVRIKIKKYSKSPINL